MANFEIGDEFFVWESMPDKMAKLKKHIEEVKAWQKQQIKEFSEKEERLENEIKQLKEVLSATADETEREEIRDRIKALESIIDKGADTTVTFYMTKDYKYNFSPNTRIKYKEVIDSIDRYTGRPIYKSHYINVHLGRVRTSNPEEIAFLDLHKGYYRESDRELTPLEKEKLELERLRLEKEETERKVADMKKILEKGSNLIKNNEVIKDGSKNKK